MFPILALILAVSLAIHTSKGVARERELFRIVGETTAVEWLIWLAPIPFLLLLIHRAFLGLFFPAPLGAMFFLPAVFVAATGRRKFDTSGHPRAKVGFKVLDSVVTFGILGMLGTGVVTGLLWVFR